MLHCAESSILPNENFREFFIWRVGGFAFSNRELPVARNWLRSALTGSRLFNCQGFWTLTGQQSIVFMDPPYGTVCDSGVFCD